METQGISSGGARRGRRASAIAALLFASLLVASCSGKGPALGASAPDASCTGSTCPVPVKVADVTCTEQKSAGTREFTLTSPSPDHATATTLRLADSSNDPSGLLQTIERGGETLLRVEGHRTPDGTDQVRMAFGAGFAGVHEIVATRNGGVTHITLDGREAVAPAPGDSQASGRFVDGQPPPAVTVDPVTIAALQNIQQHASSLIPGCNAPGGSSMSSSAAASGETSAPRVAGAAPAPGTVRVLDVEGDACHLVCGVFGSSCDCCSGCCDATFGVCAYGATVGYGACFAAALTTGPGIPFAEAACAISFGLAEEGCFSEVSNCTNSCAGSDQCVGPLCSAGTPSPSAPGLHCSPGAVCCSGPMSGTGSSQDCCDKQSDCCGGLCLEGVQAGGKCLDPNKGVFCLSSGDVCGPTANNYCCPNATPKCRTGTAAPALCCAANAGDVCQGGTMCCPSGSPKCLNGQSCCGSSDITCGPNSGCCPLPGTCAGGQCCNKPSTVCGSNCCASTDTCTPAHNICCGPGNTGSTVCGNDCCQLGESCVGGSNCCATGNVCGNSCCSAGQSCVNGTCQTDTCAAGLVSCHYANLASNPGFCCSSTVSCSTTQCCNAVYDGPNCTKIP